MSNPSDVFTNAVSETEPSAIGGAAHLGLDDLKSLRRRLSELQSELSATGSQQRRGNPPADAVEKLVQERLRDFAATLTGWFWETDAALRFTYFSPSVEDITGVPAEWHYGKTREDFGLPESVRPEDWEAHLDSLRRREPFTDFVFQRRGPDGIKWMRTSGKPVFDDLGEFQGYRGTASVITDEVEAKQRSERLTAAIENFDELFVLWGPDDRLVICNQQFRDINARVIDSVQPGELFEDHIRAAMAAGLYPAAEGWEEEWIQNRLARHREPGAPFEMQRQDGRWILLTEQRLPDGSTATISTDITQRKQAEQALADKHDVLNTVLATIPDGVQVLDRNLDLVAWNDRLFHVLDLDAGDILGAKHPERAFREAMAENVLDRTREARSGMATLEIMARTSAPVQYDPIRFEQQLSSGKWIECRGHPLPGGGFLAIYRDIDDSKELFAQLEELATTDALTEIPYRRSFLERATGEFARSKRHGSDVSILMIDVDHFKAVNDRHGHAAGDDVLRQIAQACNGALRGSDILGRIGGEEFAALLPEADSATARLVADRLRRAVVNLANEAGATPTPVSVSIGIATTNLSAETLETIMANADTALYQAKQDGRNRAVLFAE